MSKTAVKQREFDYKPYILVGKPSDLDNEASSLQFKTGAEVEELEGVLNWGTYREELYTGVKVVEDIEVEVTPKNVQLLKVGNLMKLPDIIEMGTGDFRLDYHLYELVEMPKIYGETLVFSLQSLTYRLTDLLIKRPYRSLKKITPENMVKGVSDMADCGYVNMCLNIETPDIEQKGKINITTGSSLGSVLLGKTSIMYTYFGLIAARHNKGVTMRKRRGVDRPGAYIAGTNLKTLEETADLSEIKSCIYCNADTLGGDRETLKRIVAKAEEDGATGLEVIGDTVYLSSPYSDLYAFPRMRATSMNNPSFSERTAETTEEEKEKLFNKDYEWFRHYFCEYYSTYEANKKEGLPDFSVVMEIDEKSRLYGGEFKRAADLGVGDKVLVKSEAYGIERRVEVSAIERDVRTGEITRAEFGSLTKGLGRWLEFENLVDDTINERIDDLTANDEEEAEGFTGDFDVNPDFQFEEWLNFISVAEQQYWKDHKTKVRNDSAEYWKDVEYGKFYGFNPSGQFSPIIERDSELWAYQTYKPGAIPKDNPEKSTQYRRRKEAQVKFDEELEKLGKASAYIGGGEVRLALYDRGEMAAGLFLLGTFVALVKVHGVGKATTFKQVRSLFISSCSPALNFRVKDPALSIGQSGSRGDILGRSNFSKYLKEQPKLIISQKDITDYEKYRSNFIPVTFNGTKGATLFEVRSMDLKEEQLKRLVINKSNMCWYMDTFSAPRGGSNSSVQVYQGVTSRGENWLVLGVGRIWGKAKYEGLTVDQIVEASEWFTGVLLKRYQAPQNMWGEFKGKY